MRYATKLLQPFLFYFCPYNINTYFFLIYDEYSYYIESCVVVKNKYITIYTSKVKKLFHKN